MKGKVHGNLARYCMYASQELGNDYILLYQVPGALAICT